MGCGGPGDMGMGDAGPMGGYGPSLDGHGGPGYAGLPSGLPNAGPAGGQGYTLPPSATVGANPGLNSIPVSNPGQMGPMSYRPQASPVQAASYRPLPSQPYTPTAASATRPPCRRARRRWPSPPTGMATKCVQGQDAQERMSFCEGSPRS